MFNPRRVTVRGAHRVARIAQRVAPWRVLLTQASANVKNIAQRPAGWWNTLPTNPFKAWPSGVQAFWDAVMRRGKYRRLRALSQYHRSDFGLLRHSCRGDIK